MSDFDHSGWGIFIALVTVVSLLACLALLVIASKRAVMAGDNTTGHVWDEDLVELNNPLPRWWMWLFVITVVFAAVYLAFYPGLGSNAGTLNWSSQSQFEASGAEEAEDRRRHGRRCLGARRAGHGHRAASFSQQLRAVPWF